MRYLVAALVSIGLVILVIILLVRAIFGGGGDVQERPAPLVDYANSNVIVRTTISGPIVSNEEHEEIRIDVSQYTADIRTITGYEGRVTSSNRFNSNPSAYASFLSALDLMGYTQGNDDEELADERGRCHDGNRYVFEIIDGSDVVQRYWSTSCRGEGGTFQGQTREVVDLFKAQIPRDDYRDITRQLSIR